MDQCNSVHNPAVPGFKLTKDEGGVKVDSTLYKQIVGSLMYLTATRPDLMFIVSLISRYMESPTERHLLAAKRILRYIKGTTNFGIFYKKGGNTEFLDTRTATMPVTKMIEEALRVMFSLWAQELFLGHQRNNQLSPYPPPKQNS
jgi:hypothetical protein